MSFKRFNRRKEAKHQLSILSKDPNNVIIIHYSCESFYDRAGKGSPRITSIVVRNFQNAQTKSFSIHKYAEIQNVPFEDIDQKYNELEKKMLKEFYDYLESHREYKFVHWNMRDENYGFGAIAHRFKVLGGKPNSIHESNLFDLSRILVGYYSVFLYWASKITQNNGKKQNH